MLAVFAGVLLALGWDILIASDSRESQPSKIGEFRGYRTAIAMASGALLG